MLFENSNPEPVKWNSFWEKSKISILPELFDAVICWSPDASIRSLSNEPERLLSKLKLIIGLETPTDLKFLICSLNSFSVNAFDQNLICPIFPSNFVARTSLLETFEVSFKNLFVDVPMLWEPIVIKDPEVLNVVDIFWKELFEIVFVLSSIKKEDVEKYWLTFPFILFPARKK